jgi:hypothetical protein
MTTAEPGTITVCNEAIDALRVLDAARLETLQESLQLRASALALEVHTLVTTDRLRELAEVSARFRVLARVIRATGENLSVLRRAGVTGMAGILGEELPWAR